MPDDPISSKTVLEIYICEYGLRHSEKQRERKMIVISNKEKDISRNLSLKILMTGAFARARKSGPSAPGAGRLPAARVAVSMQADQASARQGRRLGGARGQNF